MSKYSEASLIADLNATIAQLEAENERLRSGINSVVVGGYTGTQKYDKCSHGLFGYEECTNCIDEYLENLINPQGDTPPTKEESP